MILQHLRAPVPLPHRARLHHRHLCVSTHTHDHMHELACRHMRDPAGTPTHRHRHTFTRAHTYAQLLLQFDSIAELDAPNPPGAMYYGAHGSCSTSLMLSVRVTRVVACISASHPTIESPMSAQVTKDFVYSGSGGCFHEPMFQDPTDSAPVGTIGYNLKAEPDRCWDF